MLTLADQVKVHLEPSIGLKLSRITLAADMRTLQFVNTTVRANGSVVGEYSLHVQCPRRLEANEALITGSGDLNVVDKKDGFDVSFDLEANKHCQDAALRELLKGYDEDTKQIVNSTPYFVAESVETDSVGGFSLRLTGGY